MNAAALVREEEPIARHLPLRASPGTFERWVEVADEPQLVATIRAARAERLAIRLVPPFHDALPPEGGVSGVALRLGAGFEGMERRGAHWFAGAAVPLARLASVAAWPALAAAGGCVGDAIDEGWLVPAVLGVRRFKGRAIEDVDGAYVSEPRAMILGATLDTRVVLKPHRAGTAFLEPGKRVALRATLARAQLPSLRLYDAALADDDPAVLVNRGEATPKQLRLLLQAVLERVRVTTGVELSERLVAPGRGGRW
ncbi:MAG: hypothetical protein EXR71_08190 [Myxococcales bacterium]|nr:hypothetical protein [Myxococcales bacterium]